jgi:hypothetical protein
LVVEDERKRRELEPILLRGRSRGTAKLERRSSCSGKATLPPASS